MKKINWNKLKQNALSTIIAFPVELVLSIVFFVFIVFHEENYWQYDEVNRFLFFIPLFWILSFCFNHLFSQGGKRWIYYLSVALPVFIPLIAIELFSLTYFVIWLIALACLLACRKQSNNLFFTIDSLRFPFHIAIAGVLTLSLSFLLLGIYTSLVYIFDLTLFRMDKVAYYLFMLPLSLIAPFLLCLFQRLDQNKYDWTPDKFIIILANWIVSPALLAYSALLYVYGLKILITWDLPKGMLSYMIAVFLFIAVIARAVQELLPRKHYNWFYGRFNLIAIPVLILFWIGIIYRIGQYGFTEERIFLLVFAIQLSVITLAPVVSGKARYLHFVYLVVLMLAPITFIPAISANKLGLISQEQRLKKIIEKLDLRDPETGLIRNHDIPESIYDNSSKELYNNMTDKFNYILTHTSSDYMTEKFGYPSVQKLNAVLFNENWPEYLMPNPYRASSNFYKTSEYNLPIDGYKELLMKNFVGIIQNDSVILKSDSLIVTAFDIKNFIADHPAFTDSIIDQKKIDSLLYLKNDSCMASIYSISFSKGKISHIFIDYILIK